MPRQAAPVSVIFQRHLCIVCAAGSAGEHAGEKTAINPAGLHSRLLPPTDRSRPGAVWQAQAPAVIGRSDGAEI